METSIEAAGKAAKVPPQAISLEDAIALFDVMVPSEEVVMRREMERMFLSIVGAIEREVGQDQIVGCLKQRWPTVHILTLIKSFNDERERRLQNGECVDVKPLGSPRKPKKAKTAASTEPADEASQGESEVKP